MKIGIVTWCCYHNFGTFLQAYALQCYLQQNGFDVKILNDYKYSVKQPYSVKIKSSIKEIIKKVFFPRLYKPLKLDKISDALYDSFKVKYLSVDYLVDCLLDVNQRYDVFVCGSDQIWNPGGFKRKGNDFYFASFASKPKIAYAPSLGLKSIPSECKEYFSQLISDFAFLSVREHSASLALGDICKRPIDVVVDPTLLVDRIVWQQLVGNEFNSEKYIFLYLLTNNEVYISAAYDYAQRHGLKVKVVKACGVDLGIEEAKPAGPLEFLHLLAGASYVMTDSFHAAIFSLVYRKAFVVFKRFKETDDANQNSRVENLLNKLGLIDRLLDEKHLQTIDRLEEVDFNKVDKMLSREIQHSREYLIKALKVVQNERS